MRMLNCLVCFATLLAASPASGSDVEPYLEESTLAVARIDLQHVDLPQTLKKINELAPNTVPQPVQSSVNLIGGGLVASLKQSGVEHVYVMLSTLDIMQGHVSIFVPTTDTASVAETLSAITAMLPAKVQYQVNQVSDGLFIAPPEVIERLRQRPAAKRPELEKALLNKPATITLAIALRDDLRQSVTNLLPEALPGEVPFPFSPKQLAADLESMTLQAIAPELSTSIVLNATDGHASERLERLSQQYASLLPTNQQVIKDDVSISLTVNRQDLLPVLSQLSQAGSEAVAESQESNNLKQVALAMWNFESAYGVLPPRMSVSEDGTPLLSWRVHLLPFMNEKALYDQFHLDEPWDSPHNIQLIEKIPAAYQSLEHRDLKPGYTCVQQPLGEGSLWNGDERKLLRAVDMRDGTSNTLGFVIAPKQRAVPWTKPEELSIDPASPVESLFGDREQMLFALMDGSVQTLKRSDTTAERIMAALTHQGSEVLNLKK